MKKNRKFTLGITLIITLLLAVMTTGMAFAAVGDLFEKTDATIVGINKDEGTITIEVGGDTFILQVVSDKFSFDKFDDLDLTELDLIDVQGTYGEDDLILVTELKISVRAGDRMQEGEGDSFYCGTDPEKIHPVVEKIISETYAEFLEEEDVDFMATFCADDVEQMGLGKIMLILQTAELSDEYTITDFIAGGFEGITSWGQIWENIDGTGKPAKGEAPGEIKQGEVDPEETDADAKGKKNQDGEGLCDEEDGPFCEVYEWFQQQQPQKGKK